MTDCNHKVKYVSKAQAKEFLHQVRLVAEGKHVPRGRKDFGAKREKRKEQRTYECPNCGFWHLTSLDLDKFNNA